MASEGRPLRLMLISERLGPSGVTTYTENLVGALARRHRVLLVTPGGSDSQRVGQLAEKMVVLPGLARWGMLKPGKSKLLAAAAEFKPELVHALSGHATAAANLVSLEMGLPEIITSHHYLTKAGELKLHRRVRRVLAVSQALRENLVNTGKVGRDRVNVVPNGINLASYQARKPTDEEVLEGVAPQLPVVGFYGRLTVRKGAEYLVRAAGELENRGVEAEYLFVGEGPDRHRLEKLACQLGVRKRITFREDPPPARDVMPTFDIFVAPSLQEAFGINIVEAMACCVPVVASAVGGIFTVIKDCENGLLAPPRDHMALADRIGDLVLNRGLRWEIARAGRESVKQEFSIDAMLAATESAYYAAFEKGKSAILRP
jgi:glycosyltransferase involved in cell wall biosynthesis